MPVPKPLPIQSISMRPATVLLGIMQSLLMETLTGTQAGSRKLYLYRCMTSHDNISRDAGIEIPEAWMPMVKKHNNKRTYK